VEVHQLGKFQVKGAAAPVEIVQVTLAHLAARRHLLQQLPPKTPKGHCLQPLSGLVASVSSIRLPGVAQLYKQQHQQQSAATAAARQRQQQQQQGERLPGAASSGDLTLWQRSVIARASGMFGSVAAASGRAFSWGGSAHSASSNSSSRLALMGLRLSMSQQQQQQQGVQGGQAGAQVSLVSMNGVSGEAGGDAGSAQQQQQQQQLVANEDALGSELDRSGMSAASAAAGTDNIV
jgi:hypothetical protein